MKICNKIAVMAILTAFISIGTGCKDTVENFASYIENEIKVEIGESVYAIQMGEDSEGITIRPDFNLKMQSADENIAKVVGDKIKGVQIGKTEITVYHNNQIEKIISVEVTANYTIRMVSGEMISIADALPDMGVDFPESNNYYYVSDNEETAYIDTYNYDNLIYAGKPGVAYLYRSVYTNSLPVIEVIVSGYSGPAPFVTPELNPNQSYDSAVEKMASFNQTAKGLTIFNHIETEYITYSPYGNAESITLYFAYDKVNNIVGALQGFDIDTKETTSRMLGYLFSNYSYGNTKLKKVTLKNIFGGSSLNYFIDGEWYISSNNLDAQDPWQKLTFKSTPNEIEIKKVAKMKAGTKAKPEDLDPSLSGVYIHSASTEDDEIVALFGGEVYAGKPGVAYLDFNNGSTTNGYAIEVIVEPYSGSVPFEIPDVKKNMTPEEVKQIMSAYTITETGTTKINYDNCDYITYAPYGNAAEITFYFYKSYFGDDKLYYILITPNLAADQVRSYMFTNFQIGNTYYDKLDYLYDGYSSAHFKYGDWKIRSFENISNAWKQVFFE